MELEKKRGFARMTKERQAELTRKGGLAMPNERRSFATNPDLAKAAGRKGGKRVPDAKRAFSLNRKLAAEAGRKTQSLNREKK